MKNSRIGYSDFLRCLAAFAVVVLHCSANPLVAHDPGSRRFFALNLMDGGTRWAVPVFLLISGMFLLDPEKEMSTKKWLAHVGRIALATLVWGFFYILWATRGAHVGLEWFLEALIRMVKGELHYHLWYLPMLLGLYLLLPPLRALVKGASRKTLWYCVGLWFAVTVVLCTVYAYFPGGLGQSWLNQLNLYSLSTYAGFLLLGYLLKTCDLRPRRAALLYLLGAAGLVVTWLGTLSLSRKQGSYSAFFYGCFTPNVCLTAAAIFLAARQLELGKSGVWSKLAPYTFGVYLLHPLAMDLGDCFNLPRPEWNPVLVVLPRAVAAFVVALGLSWLLRHIPKLGKYLC